MVHKQRKHHSTGKQRTERGQKEREQGRIGIFKKMRKKTGERKRKTNKEEKREEDREEERRQGQGDGNKTLVDEKDTQPARSRERKRERKQTIRQMPELRARV